MRQLDSEQRTVLLGAGGQAERRLSSRGRWLAVGAGALLIGRSALGPGPWPAPTGSRTLAADLDDGFLEALREKGWYEPARDYLRLVQNSPDAKVDDQLQAAFELGVTTQRQALLARDQAARDKLLGEAQSQIEALLRQSPPPRLRSAARLQLASLLIDRARGRQNSIAVTGATAAEAENPAARAILEQAGRDLGALQQELAAQLKQLPPQTEDRAARAERLWVAADLAQARLSLANTEFELGRTYRSDSREAKDHFKAAAKKFHDLYESYRRIGAGLYAHIWEGRCHQELGETRQALSCYQDLLELPTDVKKDQKLIRAVQAAAMHHSLECWLGPAEEFAEAADRGERWLRANPVGSETESDLLAVYYLTALASQKAAAELPEKDRARRKHLQTARTFAAVAAKHPGEYQTRSKKLLERLAAKPAKAGQDEPDFAQAREEGKAAFEKAQAAAVGLRLLHENGDENADRASIANLEQERDASSSEAMQHLRRALKLADDQTPRDTLSELRFWLCLLCWEAKRYEECAELGRILGEQDLDSPQGRQGARLAMWSQVNLYNAATVAEKPALTDQVIARAEYVLDHWADQEEGGEAAGVLLSFALQQDASKAESLLQRIPESAPGRAQAELKLGLGYARNYQQAAFKPADARLQPADLAALRDQARKMLEKGLDRLPKSDDVSPSMVDAELALVQIALDEGRAQAAIERLEDRRRGLLKLVADKHAAVQREGVAAEVYRLALRAYVSARPLQMDKVDSAIAALEQRLSGGQQDAEQRLLQIYLGVARDLQIQLQSLRQQGGAQDAAAASAGFERLIARISRRSQAGSYESQSWLAETLFGMASALDPNGSGPVSAQAKDYYEQAAAAYERMLAEHKQHPQYLATVESQLGVKLRLAVCCRRIGKFHDAVLLLIEVLKQRPNNLTAQSQAAATYQDRGAVDSDYFIRAIKGGETDPKQQNLFWGWGKLAKMSMNDEKFRDTFFEARYRLAECRFEFAIRQNNEVARKKVLNEAKTDIKQTLLFKVNLGGPEMSERFDALLQRIQAELHEKQLGLEELRPAAAAK